MIFLTISPISSFSSTSPAGTKSDLTFQKGGYWNRMAAKQFKRYMSSKHRFSHQSLDALQSTPPRSAKASKEDKEKHLLRMPSCPGYKVLSHVHWEGRRAEFIRAVRWTKEMKKPREQKAPAQVTELVKGGAGRRAPPANSQPTKLST